MQRKAIRRCVCIVRTNCLVLYVTQQAWFVATKKQKKNKPMNSGNSITSSVNTSVSTNITEFLPFFSSNTSFKPAASHALFADIIIQIFDDFIYIYIQRYRLATWVRSPPWDKCVYDP